MGTWIGAVNWRHFHAGSPMHAAVVVGVATACAAVAVAGNAARRRGPTPARRFELVLCCGTLAVWVGVVAFNLLPAHRGWDASLPLHVCHVAGLAAPVALIRRARVARAITYFVGLGLCTQAFLTPVLDQGPAYGAFWVCWVWHGAIMVAVVYDLAVRRYRPTWHDWRLAVGVTAVYVPVVFLVDWRLGTMYGWVGPIESDHWTLLTPFGRWPGRVPWVTLTACGIMAALAAAWPHNRQRPPVARPFHLPVALPRPDRVRSAA